LMLFSNSEHQKLAAKKGTFCLSGFNVGNVFVWKLI
jgi:hypothetical protein